MRNWDDLRYLLAFDKNGSMATAAKFLNTNSATVSRRIARMSEELGFPVLIKESGGWTISPRLNNLLSHVADFDENLQSIRSQLSSVSGVGSHLTLGVPPVLTEYLLVPNLPNLLITNPDISVEFSDLIFQEGLGSNDLIVTSIKPEKGRLITRYLSKLEVNIYGYEKDAEVSDWIGLNKSYDKHLMRGGYLELLGTDPKFRMGSYVQVAKAMRETHLPGPMLSFLAKREEGMVPLDLGQDPIALPVYLCYHESRRQDPILQSVADWMAESLNTLL